jgi:penicillin-binding protein 1C
MTAAAACVFAAATILCLEPVSPEFDRITAESESAQVLDRNGVPLSVSYRGAWNTQDVRPLYDLPEFLVTSFIFSEDRKFYDHGGVDWKARAGALWQNIRHGKSVRGASTITEQVVRMVNPRPRTLWSKWLEGIEATLLEQDADKASILEFYLNQLPYASNRRGVAQAARYYFNRDLETLDAREILALAVLARAPSAYDLYRHPGRIDAPLERLASSMTAAEKISPSLSSDIAGSTLDTLPPSLPVDARHFARYVRLNTPQTQLRTTLDAGLQAQVQDLLDARLKKLSSKHVANAAALVVDHTTGDILAWVVAGANDEDTKAGEIDAVTTPRQPGSTLKPFLYASTLEKGWNAATILNDAPIAEAVGSGLHRFRNYSNSYYGPITLREALGNSLNIPAVLAIDYIGVGKFLATLHALGFDSLDRGASVYDEGLALGNGEVTLLELVRAYSAVANRGEYRNLRVLLEDTHLSTPRKIYSPETSSIISNILSDPRARALEFGGDSILNLPVRTAVKTGTSTDYRDAWTVGYNDRYTVGLWMGNLDRTPMKDVTGSTGPALAMRSIFNLLNRGRDTQPLYLSPALLRHDVCTRPADEHGDCPTRTEFFNGEPDAPLPSSAKNKKIELVRPTEGLMLARDPRIPADHQKFRFELAALAEGQEAEWILDGVTLARTAEPRYLWAVERGTHRLQVNIHRGEKVTFLEPVTFIVR